MSIVAIAVLLALVAYSVSKQRGGRRQDRADEEARTAGGDEQRQRSLRRRADAKASARADH
ncbi:MAG: hypothetical protein ACRDLQ_05320 [Solirubrobacterales bacterium]